MKKLHIQHFLATNPKLQQPIYDLFHSFLNSEEIKAMSDGTDISYKKWCDFIKLKSDFDLQGEEPLRNFFRIWRLQSTRLPFLLSYQRLKRHNFNFNIRALELKQHQEWFFSEVYGFKTVHVEKSANAHLMSIHPYKSIYMREAYSKDVIPKQEMFDYIECKSKCEDEYCYLLAGTSLVETKIKALWAMGDEEFPDINVETIKLDNGLYAVKISCNRHASGKEKEDPDLRYFYLQAPSKSIEVMGSTYSFFNYKLSCIMDKIVAQEKIIPQVNPDILNTIVFNKTYQKGQDLILDYLFESIKKCQPLLQLDSIKYSSAIAQALNYLTHYAQWMNIYKKDYERFTYLFEMAFEEICLILMQANLYTKEDYKTILEANLNISEKYTFHREHYLVSSGMEALVLAMIAAGKDHTGHESVYLTKGNYFEIQSCLKHGVREAKHLDRIVIFNLNPSDTEVKIKPSLTELYSLIAEKIAEHPVTLIVDHTIEQPVNLEQIFALFGDWITNGKINLILCKSHQKYASFGLAKVMAGNITICSNDSELFAQSLEFLRSADQENSYYTNPEYQIMAHQLQLSGEFGFESKASLQAIEGVNFIKALCPGVFESIDVEHQFLYVRLDGSRRMSSKKNELILNVLKCNGIEFRDSFGFLRTTYLSITSDIQKLIRISIGLDSKERLVEKLYNLQFIVNQYDELTIDSLFSLLNEELIKHTSQNENYLHNKIASIYLLLLFILVKDTASMDSEHTIWMAKMNEVYSGFILSSPHVSYEQKRNITKLLLAYKIKHVQTLEQALQALAQAKLLLEDTNIAPILAKEILPHIANQQFPCALKLLELFFTEYKEKMPKDFDLKSWIVSLLDKVPSTTQIQYYSLLKTTIRKYYPNLPQSSRSWVLDLLEELEPEAIETISPRISM